MEDVIRKKKALTESPITIVVNSTSVVLAKLCFDYSIEIFLSGNTVICFMADSLLTLINV